MKKEQLQEMFNEMLNRKLNESWEKPWFVPVNKNSAVTNYKWNCYLYPDSKLS